MVDSDIAERHKLPLKKVINEFAKMENVSDELNGKKIPHSSCGYLELAKVKPIYKTFKGWEEDISKAKKWEDLPGKYARVKATHNKVLAIGNILKDEWFDPKELFEEAKNL